MKVWSEREGLVKEEQREKVRGAVRPAGQRGENEMGLTTAAVTMGGSEDGPSELGGESGSKVREKRGCREETKL